MKYIKSTNYNTDFIKENMMGPNSMKMLEELLNGIELKPNMRVLDLGCGKGLTSIFLAKEFGVKVYATDLWIEASENYERFKAWDLDDLIIPIHADALNLPYADGYFDAVISIDSYHYFGANEEYMDKYLARLLKKDGIIAFAFPGVKKEIGKEFPKEFLISWAAVEEEIRSTFHSYKWWEELLKKSKLINVNSVKEMSGQCFTECWNDWLSTDNEYAISDKKAFEAGAGDYLNFISIIASKY